MNEYVEDLMLQIAEKNRILENIDLRVNLRFDQRKRLIDELDNLLYELYKCLIYYPAGRS